MEGRILKNKKQINKRISDRKAKRNRDSKLKKKNFNKQVNKAYMSKVNLLNKLVTRNFEQESVGAVPIPTQES